MFAVSVKFNTFDVDSRIKTVKQPHFKFLVTFLVAFCFERCADYGVCSVLDAEYKIAEWLIQQSCTVGQGREALPNLFLRMEIMFELDPFRFLRI